MNPPELHTSEPAQELDADSILRLRKVRRSLSLALPTLSYHLRPFYLTIDHTKAIDEQLRSQRVYDKIREAVADFTTEELKVREKVRQQELCLFSYWGFHS